MDFNDFPPHFGSNFEYFSSLFQKVEKAQKQYVLLVFLKAFACQNHPKYHPKYDLENERLQKLQKVVFLMILGSILEAKSIKKRIKIDSENRFEKTSTKTRKRAPKSQKNLWGAGYARPPLFRFSSKKAHAVS